MNPRRILWVVVLLLGATASAQATEVVVYYHTDALHSATTITNAQGQVIERTHYAPYGQVLNRALRDGPGYAGHEEDAATGLVYMQQRYYDPESGTFISADPVEANAGAGFNRYAYANDNPYRYTDPDGECPTDSKPCPPPPPKPKPQPKPKTLQPIVVIGHAIPAAPGLPSVEPRPIELPELPLIGPLIGVVTDPIFIVGVIIPGNLAPSDCGDGRCGPNVVYSKGGNQNVRDTGLIGVSDEEIKRRLADPNTPGTEKRRLQREQKARGIRNKTKRGGGG